MDKRPPTPFYPHRPTLIIFILRNVKARYRLNTIKYVIKEPSFLLKAVFDSMACVSAREELALE